MSVSYSEMSDFEINKEVALLRLDYEDLAPVPLRGTNVLQWGDGANWHHFDPCNSWADAGPIITENKISIIPEGIEWVASSNACFVDGVEWNIDGLWDNNPLRAAMIVFLMMQVKP